MAGRISFTGKLELNAMDSKNPWLREGTCKNGNGYQSISGAIVSAINNRAFVELFGTKTDSIKTKDKDGNDIMINWSDRLDKNVVESVNDLRKNVVKIGSERHEFISSWDAIEFIKENLDKLENKVISVTGQVNKNIYNGKITDRFQIKNIYVSEDEKKNQLRINDIFYFDKSSLDVSEFDEDKKIVFNGYVETYIDKQVGNKFVPQKVVIDCKKIDFANEKHLNRLKILLAGLGAKYENGKISSTLKTGKVFKQNVEFAYHNGAEEGGEFGYDMLTDFQKMQVDNGLRTVESFKPNGNVFGERVTEYKVVSFNSNGDFAEGFIEESSSGEFEENIYEEQVEETLEEEEEEIETSTESEEEEDDLFD